MSGNGELKNVPTIKAYKNPDFLGAATSRHVRIMCELYEPMQRLDKHDISNYFIIVGSHLMMHPEDRVKHIAGLEQQLKKLTAEEEVEAVQAKLRFAQKIKAMDKFYVMAMELGKKLGEWNRQRAAKGLPSYHVSTGGGPGIMEAANRGAHEAGDKTLGFGASRPEWGSLNKYVSEEGAFEFHYFFMRKFWMAYKCMGLVVCPGGFGSLDELFELLVLLQTKKISHPLPIILLGEEFWKKTINFQYLMECGMLTQSHLDMLVFKDTAEDAFQYLVESVRKAEESGETEQVETAKRRRLEGKPSTPSRKDSRSITGVTAGGHRVKQGTFENFTVVEADLLNFELPEAFEHARLTRHVHSCASPYTSLLQGFSC
ncbi:unnamed protein product [Symbiodinium microadriaticum]|nr:unnamed protein product [Symbiodinium microadriaticum]CAE7546236.1 unnamed protein product [Symbiodinium sp. KB8]